MNKIKLIGKLFVEITLLKNKVETLKKHNKDLMMEKDDLLTKNENLTYEIRKFNPSFQLKSVTFKNYSESEGLSPLIVPENYMGSNNITVIPANTTGGGTGSILNVSGYYKNFSCHK